MEVRTWRTANPVLVLLTAAAGVAAVLPLFLVFAVAVAVGPAEAPLPLRAALPVALTVLVLILGNDLVRDRFDERFLAAVRTADGRTLGVIVDLKRHGIRAQTPDLSFRELFALVWTVAIRPIMKFWLVTVSYEYPRAVFVAAWGFVLDIGTAIGRAIRSP